MIQNYIATAMRVFARQKAYSIINILGLSIGMAASFLIFIYIQEELSYDRYFADADKIYRVGITEKFQGNEINYTETGSPLAEALRNEIPEITSSTRIGRWPEQIVSYMDKSFVENRFLLADSNFFEIFNYTLLEGSTKQCLQGPNKIVITESIARKYFGYKGIGDASPIGKLMVYDGKHAMEVTGIISDPPHRTHMKFDFILSLDTWDAVAKDDCWACYSVHTYFKINETNSLSVVEEKLGGFANKYVFPRIEKDLHISAQQMQQRGDRVNFFVQPLASIHLESHFDGEFEPNGDKRYVQLFGVIALFIVLIACINFMNLATARAATRAKEIGVRKTLGAIKSWLVEQFMIESFLYVFISSLVAGIIVLGSLQSFNLLTGKVLDFSLLSSPFVWMWILLFVIAVGFLAGSYPAFYLTAFKPVEGLKGKNRQGKNFNVRNSLVIFQFGISIALIISTLVINKQLKFLQQLNLGFERENILRISQTWMLEKNTDAFKNELLKHKEFISASYAFRLPPYISNDFFVKPEGTDQLYSCFHTSADSEQLETMGYQMKSGRFFSNAFPADSSSAVINETCARLIGYQDYEGKFISSGGKKKWKVIGIVKDFNFENARNKIKPLVIFLNQTPVVMAVRITKGDVAAKVQLVESIWKKLANGMPFQYSFIDEEFNALFKEEEQMEKIFSVFTGIAIFIACLGLFGLITFTSSQRTKEIGIRKVLGASIAQITMLLSGSLIRLVMISFLIAIPLTWYGMNRWLQTFAYRTDIDFSLVVVACAVGILIAILTVGYKSVEAASRNPVESLKNE